MPAVLVATLGAEPQIIPLAAAPGRRQGGSLDGVVVLPSTESRTEYCTERAMGRSVRRELASMR